MKVGANANRIIIFGYYIHIYNSSDDVNRSWYMIDRFML